MPFPLFCWPSLYHLRMASSLNTSAESDKTVKSVNKASQMVGVKFRSLKGWLLSHVHATQGGYGPLTSLRTLLASTARAWGAPPKNCNLPSAAIGPLTKTWRRTIKGSRLCRSICVLIGLRESGTIISPLLSILKTVQIVNVASQMWQWSLVALDYFNKQLFKGLMSCQAWHDWLLWKEWFKVTWWVYYKPSMALHQKQSLSHVFPERFPLCVITCSHLPLFWAAICLT